jgi:hypothetical protein
LNSKFRVQIRPAFCGGRDFLLTMVAGNPYPPKKIFLAETKTLVSYTDANI